MTTRSVHAINSVRVLILGILRQIGHASADAQAVVDTTAMDEENPILYYPTLGLWVAYGPMFPVEVKTLLRHTQFPAYSVGFIKHVNNYPHAPDEEDDVETARTPDMRGAAQALVGLLIRDLCDNVTNVEPDGSDGAAGG